MYIKELAIKNFRNFKNAVLEFSPGINFITGQNAAGKTNIIEAVSITANARSFRNVPDSEIIMWGEESYYCSGLIENSKHALFEIGCAVLSDRITKKAQIDNIEKKKISDYYGRFLTVILSPEDINIITGQPDIRRRFFDAVISKVDYRYLDNLTEYKRILLSRNSVLKKINEKGQYSSPELDVWDRIFSEKAAFILKSRKDFLDIYNISFQKTCMAMSGNSDFPVIEYMSVIDAVDSDSIEKGLKNLRKKDILTGATGIGPHRDDYCFYNDKNKKYKHFASQGQKRTATIALKVAECGYLQEKTGERPVVLIDDIFSELDMNRRKNMMDIIGDNNQAIITAVNAETGGVKKFSKIEKFVVEPCGIITKI